MLTHFVIYNHILSSTLSLACIAKLFKENCFQKIRKNFVSKLAFLGMSSSNDS